MTTPRWLVRFFGFLVFHATVAIATAGAAEGGAWETLFDGRTLAGWKAAENPASITVDDGTIRCRGPRAHLFYLGADGRAEFENFELELQVRTEPGANSGVYFHCVWEPSGWPQLAGIEVQVNNRQPVFDQNYVENKKTGSLYGVRNLYKAMVADGEWFTMNVLVQRPRVQVRLNGRLVVDYVEPTNPPALVRNSTRDALGKGTFALQCHDEKSEVRYRGIRVRRLPAGEDKTVLKPTYTPSDLERITLGRENFPWVDLHTRLTEELPLEKVVAIGNRTGVQAGVVVKGGATHAVHDDATARALISAMHEAPVFLGLEATEAGWTTLFTPELRAEFDYVVADAATWGAAVSPELDAEAQVAALVRGAESAMANGPIDVWMDPTYLPESLASRAAALWTEERVSRIVAAAVKHGVALGIDVNRQRPSAEFIRVAKGAGARFTFGSNNRGASDYGNWDYVLEVQRAAKLGWRDMWVPGHAPTRAQRAAK